MVLPYLSTARYRYFHCAFDLNIRLVHPPAHPHRPFTPVKRLFQQRAIFDDPAVDRGVIQLHPTFFHEFFDVARALGVCQIPTHAHQNQVVFQKWR